MKTSNAIETLIRLSGERADEAATRLALAMAKRSDAEARLAMLGELRTDYATKLSASAQKGLTLASLRNFQQFMEKVDQAMTGQQQLLEEAERRTAEAQNAWQLIRIEQKSYATLAERNRQAAHKQMQRLEQKANDEFASNAMARQRGY